MGLLTSLLGGTIRGAQMLKNVGAPVLQRGLRLADPRRVQPIIQSLTPRVTSTARSFVRPSNITQNIPVLNRLPGWARSIIVPSSPLGIAAGFAFGGAPGDTAQRGEQYGPPIPPGLGNRPPAGAPTVNPTTAPPPAAGPRVDAATTQALDSGYATAAPQSAQVIPATPVQPPTFELSPEGQFQRYFGTPEFDYVFGAASRGTGAPTTAEAMLALAKFIKAEKETPLATYYRAQSAAGRGQMDEIKKALGYAEGSDLAKWAEANPMLAQRLFAKKTQSSQPDELSAASKAMRQEIAPDASYITPYMNRPVSMD